MGADFGKTLEAAQATPPREDNRDPEEGWHQAGVLAGEIEKMAVLVDQKDRHIDDLMQEKRDLDHAMMNLKIEVEIQQKKIGELQERMADQATRQLEAISKIRWAPIGPKSMKGDEMLKDREPSPTMPPEITLKQCQYAQNKAHRAGWLLGSIMGFAFGFALMAWLRG